MVKRLVLIAFVLTLPVLMASGQKAEKRTISGIVVDESGVPVKGASIFIDDYETPVRTDKTGAFKVKIAPGAKIIFAAKLESGIAEETIGDEGAFYLVLNKARIVKLLEAGPDDETVDVGYGTIRKKYLTTSSGRAINTTSSKYASYSSIYEMMKGELPGVHVSGNNVYIRGIGTITGSTQPLFVVDGIAVNSVSHISPSNVQSIQVLNGANASVYGSRGSNGVILIKLKTKNN
ncbi:MAG: TonB-dependent receptor plug domain-containing protein [Bacteroidales bacterium]|nr:TonB-dependent receptor plug domain-containing protein [Bacteroidales bacterium]